MAPPRLAFVGLHAAAAEALGAVAEAFGLALVHHRSGRAALGAAPPALVVFEPAAADAWAPSLARRVRREHPEIPLFLWPTTHAGFPDELRRRFDGVLPPDDPRDPGLAERLAHLGPPPTPAGAELRARLAERREPGLPPPGTDEATRRAWARAIAAFGAAPGAALAAAAREADAVLAAALFEHLWRADNLTSNELLGVIESALPPELRAEALGRLARRDPAAAGPELERRLALGPPRLRHEAAAIALEPAGLAAPGARARLTALAEGAAGRAMAERARERLAALDDADAERLGDEVDAPDRGVARAALRAMLARPALVERGLALAGARPELDPYPLAFAVAAERPPHALALLAGLAADARAPADARALATKLAASLGELALPHVAAALADPAPAVAEAARLGLLLLGRPGHRALAARGDGLAALARSDSVDLARAAVRRAWAEAPTDALARLALELGTHPVPRLLADPAEDGALARAEALLGAAIELGPAGFVATVDLATLAGVPPDVQLLAIRHLATRFAGPETEAVLAALPAARLAEALGVDDAATIPTPPAHPVEGLALVGAAEAEPEAPRFPPFGAYSDLAVDLFHDAPTLGSGPAADEALEPEPATAPVEPAEAEPPPSVEAAEAALPPPEAPAEPATLSDDEARAWLTRLVSARALAELEQFAFDPRLEARWRGLGIRFLVELGGLGGAARALERGLADDSAEVAAECVPYALLLGERALPELGEAARRGELPGALRARIVRHLRGRLDKDELQILLAELLYDPDRRLAKVALELLFTSLKDVPDEKVEEGLTNLAKEHASPRLRAIALFALGAFGSRRARAVLTEHARGLFVDPALQAAAQRALARFDERHR